MPFRSVASKEGLRTKDSLKAFERLEGAYSNGTIRAYRTDIAIFTAWCASTSHKPLPASPDTVAAFISNEAARGCSAATLKRRIAAIRKIHQLLKMENPTVDEEVNLARRRAFRANPLRPRQALGLTKELKKTLVAACPDTLAGKRDRAMIALGYDTLCRRSELVALRLEDITTFADRGAQILIRRSKNDPYGQGRQGYISPETIKLLNYWLKAATIKDGYLFRSVRGAIISENPLHPYSVNRILKKMASACSLPEKTVRDLSGHSMRVGAAQDMITSGMSILPIMRAGGWKSMNVVARYVEHTDLIAMMNRD
jgi:integrase/recombinase XerD